MSRMTFDSLPVRGRALLPSPHGTKRMAVADPGCGPGGIFGDQLLADRQRLFVLADCFENVGLHLAEQRIFAVGGEQSIEFTQGRFELVELRQHSRIAETRSGKIGSDVKATL